VVTQVGPGVFLNGATNDPSHSHQGSWYENVFEVGQSEAGFGFTFSQAITVCPLTAYDFSAWLEIVSINDAIACTVQTCVNWVLADISETPGGGCSLSAPLTSTYTQFSGTYLPNTNPNPPDTGTNAEFVISVSCAGGTIAGLTVITAIDDISMAPVTIP